MDSTHSFNTGSICFYADSNEDFPNIDAIESFNKNWINEVAQDLEQASKQLPLFIKEHEEDYITIRIEKEKQSFELHALLVHLKDSPILDVLIPAVRLFIEACIIGSTSIDDAIWCDCETNLSQSESAFLASQSTTDVPLFIRFLETCDLGHEVEHGGDIYEVIQAHGWTNETIALWVARVGTCCGQHGHEDDWNSEPYLSDWIKADPEREELAIKLIAGNLIAIHHWEPGERMLNQIESYKDWFSTPDHGLGAIANNITDKALELSKVIASKHIEQKTTPPHWLSVL